MSIPQGTTTEPKIKILVSAHKPAEMFDSTILCPIQVGTASANKRLDGMFHDDEGENISHLNPQYCELTAQYWAWKHLDADYYGFCHYRRYFDFSAKIHIQNAFGEIPADAIDSSSQLEYGLTDEAIRRAIEGYDIVVTSIKDLNKMPGKYSTPIEHFDAAPHLHKEDLELALEILRKEHPDFAPDIDAYTNGHSSCFCNMFIMRRELFISYCEWLFPVLEKAVSKMDMAHYSMEGLRTPGHIAERLLNIFLIHMRRTDPTIKIREVPCVLFQHPEPTILPPHASLCPQPGRQVIPIALAANDSYVPMLATTLHSIVSNADPNCQLDVIVLERDISASRKHILVDFFSRWNNLSLTFYDVAPSLRARNLVTSNMHISVETFYRFLVQDLLAGYEKALYLDSDLIMLDDVAALYNIDLDDHLIGAVKDYDFLGNLNQKDGKRLAYATEHLKLIDPYGYFQAGVLLMNLTQLRKLHSVDEWLDIASQPGYIYDDQDILNAACQGRVSYLDPSWNVMTNYKHRSEILFSFAPAEDYRDYLVSRGHERVVHFAGPEKPWNSRGCDRKEIFWQYARQTPFYEELLEHYRETVNKIGYRAAEFMTDENGLKRVLEPIVPNGTRRGKLVRSILGNLR